MRTPNLLRMDPIVHSLFSDISSSSASPARSPSFIDLRTSEFSDGNEVFPPCCASLRDARSRRNRLKWASMMSSGLDFHECLPSAEDLEAAEASASETEDDAGLWGMKVATLFQDLF